MSWASSFDPYDLQPIVKLPDLIEQVLDQQTPATRRAALDLIRTAWRTRGMTLDASVATVRSITRKGVKMALRFIARLAELFGLEGGRFTFPFWDEERKRRELRLARCSRGGTTTSLRRQAGRLTQEEKWINDAKLRSYRKRVARTAERIELAIGKTQILRFELHGTPIDEDYEPGTPDEQPGRLAGRLAKAAELVLGLSEGEARVQGQSLAKLHQMHARRILSLSDSIVAMLCGDDFFLNDWLQAHPPDG